jgi:glutaminase
MSIDRPSKRRLRGVLVALLVATCVILVVSRIAQTAQLAAEIRGSQVTNTKTLNNSDQVLKVIQDCTQPDGECYKRGQSQTAAAVSSINKVVILAAACAGQHPGQSVVQIQNCVVKRLAHHAH